MLPQLFTSKRTISHLGAGSGSGVGSCEPASAELDIKASPRHTRANFGVVTLKRDWSRAMKWVFIVFVVLYGIALLLMAIGTFGWFGQEKDPLSGVFLLPLGLPWNILADRIGLGVPILAILAPAINAAILYWFWKR